MVAFATSPIRVMSNKLYERHLHAENRSHLYQPYNASNVPTEGYDSLDRLRQYKRGTLASTGGPGNAGGGSVTTPITLTNTNESAQYDLDGLRNWRRFTTDPVGGAASTQIRQHNGLNEITRAGSTDFSYDGVPGSSNGNLANDGTLKYEWDALNRLVKVYKTPSSPVLIATYTYDAMNRRVRMVVTNGGLSGTVPNGTTDCVYQGWRCVEDRDGSDTPTKQYLWGIYLDELIQVNDGWDYPAWQARYPLQDLLYRTAALTDASGTIVEACDYDAYGNTLIFDAAGSGGNWWADDATQTDVAVCPFLFTGQRFDAESHSYSCKRRIYIPHDGRYLSRDPAHLRTHCQLYEYVQSASTRLLDPLGEKPSSGECPPGYEIDTEIPPRSSTGCVPRCPQHRIDIEEELDRKLPNTWNPQNRPYWSDVLPPFGGIPPRVYTFNCPNNSPLFFYACYIDSPRGPFGQGRTGMNPLLTRCINNVRSNMVRWCLQFDREALREGCLLIFRCFDLYY